MKVREDRVMAKNMLAAHPDCKCEWCDSFRNGTGEPYREQVPLLEYMEQRRFPGDNGPTTYWPKQLMCWQFVQQRLRTEEGCLLFEQHATPSIFSNNRHATELLTNMTRNLMAKDRIQPLHSKSSD